MGVGTLHYSEAALPLRNALHSLVDEIAAALVQEIKTRSSEGVPGESKATDEFASIVAKEIALEVTQRLPIPISDPATAGQGVQRRLAALESRLEKLTGGSRESSKGEPGSGHSNLKYAKSKYQNVESLLNYIETKEADGGIKLVIMNFND